MWVAFVLEASLTVKKLVFDNYYTNQLLLIKDIDYLWAGIK